MMVNKIMNTLGALYLGTLTFIEIFTIRNIFGYMYSGCIGNWWVWEFRYWYIIPSVLLLGLILTFAYFYLRLNDKATQSHSKTQTTGKENQNG